jgi:hypothetical protein
MKIDEAVQSVIIDKLKQAIVDNDMVATRALYNSVRFEKKELLEQITINLYALDYIVGLNYGIAPMERPYPTIENLKIWIKAKGIPADPYAVRNSIIANGTTWFRIGGSNIVTDSINNEAFKQVIELATPDLKIKIKEQWQLLFKNNR